jgi:hypothetical protein
MLSQTTMRYCLLFFLCFLQIKAQAQQLFSATQYELIFSLASMNSTSVVPSKPVLRFSGFFNYESQIHFDFGKHAGIYSGLGIKNIGLINTFKENETTIKQRAYVLSMPLAFKLGSMKDQSYVALGGEANLMMHYKEKFIYGKSKSKDNEWFSNKVNLFNPAVFIQVKFMKSQVVTFKYYLQDFLRPQQGGIVLPDGTVVADYGRSSKLFYISYGSNIATRSNKQKQQEFQNIRSARLD